MPRGVALVRVQIGNHRMFFASNRLTPDQFAAAKTMASMLFLVASRSFVVVTMTDLLTLLLDAA